MKKSIFFPYLLITILLLFTGIVKLNELISVFEEPVLEEFQENKLIPHIKYAYEGLQIGD